MKLSFELEFKNSPDNLCALVYDSMIKVRVSVVSSSATGILMTLVVQLCHLDLKVDSCHSPIPVAMSLQLMKQVD